MRRPKSGAKIMYNLSYYLLFSSIAIDISQYPHTTVLQPDTARLMGTPTVCIMRQWASRSASASSSESAVAAASSAAVSAVARSSVSPFGQCKQIELAIPATLPRPPKASTSASPSCYHFVCATVNTGNEWNGICLSCWWRFEWRSAICCIRPLAPSSGFALYADQSLQLHCFGLGNSFKSLSNLLKFRILRWEPGIMYFLWLTFCSLFCGGLLHRWYVVIEVKFRNRIFITILNSLCKQS